MILPQINSLVDWIRPNDYVAGSLSIENGGVATSAGFPHAMSYCARLIILAVTKFTRLLRQQGYYFGTSAASNEGHRLLDAAEASKAAIAVYQPQTRSIHITSLL